MPVTHAQLEELRDIQRRTEELKNRNDLLEGRSFQEATFNLIRSGTAGAVRGFGNLAGTAAMVPEMAANAATRLAFPGEKGLPLRTPVSGKIFEGTDALADYLAPESNAFPYRAVESAAELVGPGALFTHGFTTLGRRFLSKPQETMNMLQRVLAAAAKDPQAAQRAEAVINSIAGIGGEGVYEAAIRGGASEQEAETQKLAAEVLLSLGTSTGQVATQATRHFVVDRFGEMIPGRVGGAVRDRLSREAVEDFFSDIFKEMGEDVVDKRYMNAEILERAIPGLHLDTAQVTRNPEIAAARDFMDRSVQGGVTRRQRLYSEQRQEIENFRNNIAPRNLESPAAAASRIQEVLDNETARFQKGIDDALDFARLEAEQARSGREIVDIGLEARTRFDIVEQWFDDESKLMYGRVANLSIGVPTSTRGGIRRAMASELEGNEWGGVSARIQNLAELNFLRGTQGSTIGQLQEFNSLVKAEIRIARRDGDTDTVRRLNHIVEGIEKDMGSAANRGGISGESARALKQANEFYRENIGIFREGQNRLAFMVDLQSADKIAPEDLTRLYIRANGQKNVLSSVEDYRRILGDGPEARSLIRDTFAIMLRRAALPEGAETFNPRLAQNFVNRHSESLRAHGLWSSFNTAGKQADQALRVQNLNARSIRDIENSVLSRVVGSDNPQEEVVKALRTGSIKKLADQVSSSGNPAANRAFRSMIWDAMGHQNIMSNPQQMANVLENTVNRHILIDSLGIDHYRDLLMVSRGLSAIDVESAASAGATGLAREASRTPAALEGKIVFAIRRMMQGFVSREFTLVEIGRFLAEGAKGEPLRQMFTAALDDPAIARELARHSRAREGKLAVYSLWSGAFAAPASQGGRAISTDEPQ